MTWLFDWMLRNPLLSLLIAGCTCFIYVFAFALARMADDGDDDVDEHDKHRGI